MSWRRRFDQPEKRGARGLVEAGQEQEALLQAIRRLPEERQQVLILKFVQEMSNVEIGQVMQRSEGAVKSLYHRTLLALRDELSKSPAPNGGRPVRRLPKE